MAISRNQNVALMDDVSKDIANEPWRKNLGRTSIQLTADRPGIWWTGLAPDRCAGFEGGKLHSLAIPNLANCTRNEVRDYFNNSWTLTELIFSSLIGDEAFYRPPNHGLRHPFIFYYGHPAVLYVQKLKLAGLLESHINPYFERIFEIGVDEMSWDDMSKNDMEWPAVNEVLEYRKAVYRAVLNVIDTHAGLEDGHAAILQSNPLWALVMGFEHERIHLETSSVLIREFPAHLVSRPKCWPENAPLSPSETSSSIMPVAAEHYPENTLVRASATSVSYGKPLSWPTYGWDNEYGTRCAQVNEFVVGSQLISNGEYWQFVTEGGYQHSQYWSEEGWNWRSYRDVEHPMFWVASGDYGAHEYDLRACFDVIAMPWNWPVVVNFHEAKAFCAWKSTMDNKSYRLPTEAEHHVLRHHCNLPDSSEQSLIVPPPHNLNLRFGSESAVNMAKSGALPNADAARNSKESPIYDLFGNLWQWCEDHFNPLDGAKVHPYYEDFSTPCYDGRHHMIMGGSFVSSGDEATPWARFHFRPHFFQQAGFRVVHSPSGSDGCVKKIS